ncbi:MAG TPA: PilT/PilU family type 4a pilus ATPase [Opitutaceae bacterium]|jgi:twitching motility protein PilT|nr:PilT/PilU family type 4a pilus ATPase [Opitutaceae bacterium]
MQPDVSWLVRLSVDQGLLTLAQAAHVRSVLGDSAGLIDFAQKLIDDGIVNDVALLEKIAGVALAKGKDGPPVSDPFDEREPVAAAEPDKPEFPFDRLTAMDDVALATALRELLRATAKSGASDLHLSTGARPFIRKNRELAFLSDHTLTADGALRLNTALLSSGQRKIFLECHDYDYALAVGAADRYRVNLMFHKQGAAGAYRMVPAQAKSLADLGFTTHLETLKRLLSYHNGLILITGPVGAGKTTTLAAMVAYLNETREDHIITVEDPIEVVQPARGCNVTQREVGGHTKSFAAALKGALREDPDVIVIGELRDLETIEMAVSAAETGHLVIGTMHTSDAATTLNRLLDVFPPAQQTQIRATVAESLRGIVCQRLLSANDGQLVLACEILINNLAIASLIREGKSTGLRNTMETGVRDGMCLMDNVIFGLWQEGKISRETALANITNRVLRGKIS